MAFIMKANIKIEGFKAFSPSTATWQSSVLNYVNEASVVIPAKCSYNGTITTTSSVIAEGKKIVIEAGYNNKVEERFRGFISRVDNSVPLKLVCEGYSYQLRKVTNFTKSYLNTDVKAILKDLIAGTDIVLSDAIPSIPIDKVEFVNLSGLDVLEWLKEQCLLTVYFNNEELYVGLQQAETTEEVNIKLGWNTASEKGLKFGEKQLAEVNIQLESKDELGQKKKASTGSSNTKVLKTKLLDEAAMAKIAEQKRKELVHLGYEGTVDLFLQPMIKPGQTAKISDEAIPDRAGQYFVSAVSGSFSKSGGRQKTSIGYQV